MNSQMMNFDDAITNIITEDDTTTAIFRTKDVTMVNMLRRAVLTEIKTFCIDIVVYDINNSAQKDEHIALRLGLLNIDHTRFNPPENGDFESHIHCIGPGKFTTEDIPGLPFKHKTTIMMLREGDEIKCKVIVKEGISATHAKWCPISTFTFKKIEDAYLITFKDNYMLPPREILEKGFNLMSVAAGRSSSSIFSHPLVPLNLLVQPS